MTFEGEGGFLLLRGLAPRDRRAILLGLLAVIPVLGYVFVVRPYRAALSEARDRVAAEQQLLSREVALLESRESLPEAIRRAEEAAARAEERMLQAPSLVLAEEELTNLLEDAAVRNRVFLEEIRTGELGRGEDSPPELSVVRLHLRGESDLQGILSFLGEVEGSPVLLRVRGVALEPEMARSEVGEGENREQVSFPTGVVTFQLIVDGFARPEEGPGPRGSLTSGRAD